MDKILFNRYKSLTKFETKSQNEVYKVLDTLTGQVLALKVLKQFEDSEVKEDFKVEFERLKNLNSPALVKVYDFAFTSDGQVYYTMDFINGTHIDEFFKEANQENQILILRQIIWVLQYLHSQDVIHGDLKPENILVTENEGFHSVKLIDFGLSNFKFEINISGTLEYLLPEEIEKKSFEPQEKDFYALGVILYKCFLGETPFNHEKNDELLKAKISYKTEEIQTECKNLVKPFDNLIFRLLKRKRTERLRDYDELFRILEGKTEFVKAKDFHKEKFTGREKEFAKLKECFEETQGYIPQAILVEGEAGIGKSRLVAQLKSFLQLQETYVFFANSLNNFEEENFYSVSQILKQILFVDDFKKLLKPEQEEMFSLVLKNFSKTKKTNREILKSQFFLNFYEFCYEVSRVQPITLLVDNIQNEDTGGVEVWNYFTQKLAQKKNAGIFLIFTQRSEEESEIDRANLNEILALKEFTKNEVKDFINSAIGEEISTKIYLEIFRQTKGNPLLVVEIVSFLAQKTDTDFSQNLEGIPNAFGEIVEAKLQSLTENETELVQNLSVLGNSFEVEWVENIFPKNENLAEELGSLAENNFLDEEQSRFEFKHPKFREIIYSKIAAKDKSEKHSEIANFFLKKNQSLAELLAFHLSRGKNPEKAIPFLLTSGQNAFEVFAYRNAQNYYFECEKILAKQKETKENLEFQFRVIEGLNELSEFLGYSGMEKRLEKQLEIGEKKLKDDRKVLVALHNFMKFYNKYKLLEKEPLECFDKAMTFYEKGFLKDKLYVDFLLRKVIGGISVLKPNETYGLLREAFELTKGLENSERTLCSIHNLFAVVHEKDGKGYRAIDSYVSALQIAYEHNITSEIIVLQSNLSDQVNKRIGPEIIQKMLENSYALAQNIGIPYYAFNTGFSLSQVYRKLYLFDDSKRIFKELLEFEKELNVDGYPFQINMLSFWQKLDLGYLDEALEIAEELVKEIENADFFVPISLGLFLLVKGAKAEILLEKGEEKKALECLKEDKKGNFPFPKMLTLQKIFYGIILFKSGKLEKAKEVLEASILEEFSILPQNFKDFAISYLARINQDFEISERIILSKDFRVNSMSDRWRLLWNHFVLAKETNQEIASQRKILNELFSSVVRCAFNVTSKVDRKNFLENNIFARKIFDEYFQFFYGEEAEEIGQNFFENLLEKKTPIEDLLESSAEKNKSSILELNQIVKISNILNSSSEPQIILNNLIDLAIEYLEAERGLIILHDKINDSFSVKVGRNIEKQTILDVTKISQTIVKDVTQGEKSVFSFKLDEDERFSKSVSVINLKIRSLVCVPLRKGDEIIGTIYLDTLSANKSFGEKDVIFLEAIANLAIVSMSNAENYKKIRKKTVELQSTVEEKFNFHNIISKDEKMLRVFNELNEVAKTEISVLIYGESGTGKELIAKAIHYQSNRKEQNFVAVDCGAIPETMIESELFGHKKGAFSGAVTDKRGLFEEADGGTIFLDEITNTSYSFQARLLRVLQEKEIRRVGENNYRKIDVRVVAATNLDVLEEIEKGKFREDLYFRLNNFSINLPPLRERKGDFELLVNYFVKDFCELYKKNVNGISEELLDRMSNLEWKGNVRELRSVVGEMVLRQEDDFLDIESLPKRLKPKARVVSAETFLPQKLVSLDESQRIYIRKVLEKTKWNKSEAARILGLPLSTLRSKMKKLGINS
ncbi:MAG: GAF domain-containing protein [Calditrichaeota bacterium]|nr:MAG: GAF domain-containing protein [Calditrichota bacterium]